MRQLGGALFISSQLMPLPRVQCKIEGNVDTAAVDRTGRHPAACCHTGKHGGLGSKNMGRGFGVWSKAKEEGQGGRGDDALLCA